LQFFKGTRINVYKTFFKDLLAAKVYLRIYSGINGLEFFREMENSNWRFFYVSMLSAHISSFISPLFLTPFDVAKTKALCEIASPKKAMYSGSFASALLSNIKAQGFKSIFQGTSYAQLSSILSSVLIVSGTHFISLNESSNISSFLGLNALVSLIVYPIDTLTFDN
jgi:hypothetical protein